MHQCHGTAAELECEPVGQFEPVVGVPGDGVNLGVRCAVAQGLSYGWVADVARVEDGVSSARCPAIREVRRLPWP